VLAFDAAKGIRAVGRIAPLTVDLWYPANPTPQASPQRGIYGKDFHQSLPPRPASFFQFPAIAVARPPPPSGTSLPLVIVLAWLTATTPQP